ncbi:MAG: CGNR zinc finger domain-containing protein [Acidobacteria bacterium]|nr:CGNR zinc finger domain-containing protein [Acidobacteriota bacterium]
MLADPKDFFAPWRPAQLAEVDRNRVRNCRHCVLRFYDTSKKGARRWCSMQLCGNRLKVTAYAACQRANDRN